MRTVLQPYHRGDPFNWDVEIPERDMDGELARVLRGEGDLSLFWKAQTLMPHRPILRSSLTLQPNSTAHRAMSEAMDACAAPKRGRPRRGSMREKKCSVA
jgi:hypothetical protein